MHGVSFDVTQRKLTEEALLESEMRFRVVADAAPVMIWMSGPDKDGVFFNKGWLEFTGRPLDKSWARDGWKGFTRKTWRTVLRFAGLPLADANPLRSSIACVARTASTAG